MGIRRLVLLFLLLPLTAVADGLVKKQSVHSVEDTIDRLEELVTEKGMTVFARIDHRANAESVGMEMSDSQVLLFGSPKAGTRIMMHDRAAGLDLPLRVLAYRDHDGNTQVVYRNPQALKQDFSVDECKVIDKVETALDGLTGQIIQ